MYTQPEGHRPRSGVNPKTGASPNERQQERLVVSGESCAIGYREKVWRHRTRATRRHSELQRFTQKRNSNASDFN